MKRTLNPFENAKRIANGAGGGVSPTIIEEMQEEITILGSQNTQQAQDITDIKAQLTELAGAYSTTEHKTGRKWTDGKDIFEKTIVLDVTTLSNNTTIAVLNDVTDMSLIVNAGLVVKASSEIGFDHALCYMNIVDNKLYMKPTSNWNNVAEAKLIIEYTKTGA